MSRKKDLRIIGRAVDFVDDKPKEKTFKAVKGFWIDMRNIVRTLVVSDMKVLEG